MAAQETEETQTTAAAGEKQDTTKSMLKGIDSQPVRVEPGAAKKIAQHRMRVVREESGLGPDVVYAETVRTHPKEEA